jgi:hypothetical protein
VTVDPSAATADDTGRLSQHPDVHAFRDYLRRQFAVLVARHPLDQAMLVRVLGEEYQRAAGLAKDGNLEAATAAMAMLGALEQLPTDGEPRQALDTVALPAEALVAWRSGDAQGARVLLHRSLDRCGELSPRGHDYLTARQLHLALNIARLDAERDPSAAAGLLARVVAVAEGDADAWPFSGARRLRVPLSGIDHAAITAQIHGLRARMSRAEPRAARS